MTTQHTVEMNKDVVAITNRIIERSKATRSAYLKKLMMLNQPPYIAPVYLAAI